MTDSTFENRIAVVTGAAQGLGLAIATLLGRRGAKVWLVDLDGPRVKDAAGTLADQGISAMSYVADITDEESLHGLRGEVLGNDGRIDVLINNAGMYPHEGIRDVTVESWDKVFDVNVKSMFLTTRTFMDPMIDAGYGRVVSIASNDAYTPKVTMPHYAAAKAGVISLIKTFAAELAPYQVLVNGVSPGAIATERAKGQDWLAKRIPQIPLKRAAGPEQIAEVVAFLASDKNQFMTGETVIANGGMLMV